MFFSPLVRPHADPFRRAPMAHPALSIIRAPSSRRFLRRLTAVLGAGTLAQGATRRDSRGLPRARA
jgi:hypothetical protein